MPETPISRGEIKMAKEIAHWLAVNFASIALVIATIVLAYYTWGLREATKRSAGETTWRSHEEHFQRMMVEALKPAGPLRQHAIWELVTIAEEGGAGRRRDQIIRLFEKLSQEEEKIRQLPNGIDIMSTRGFLETWQRDGIDYNMQETYDGVDGTRTRKAGLIQRLWWEFQRWRYQDRVYPPRVETKAIKEGIKTIRHAMTTVEIQLRSLGVDAHRSEVTWTKLVAGRDGELRERPVLDGNAQNVWGETDWEKVARRIPGWRWTASVVALQGIRGLPGRGEVRVTGTWSHRAPLGEWKVEGETRHGDGMESRDWQWRSEGTKWTPDGRAAAEEIQAAGRAVEERLRKMEREWEEQIAQAPSVVDSRGIRIKRLGPRQIHVQMTRREMDWCYEGTTGQQPRFDPSKAGCTANSAYQLNIVARNNQQGAAEEWDRSIVDLPENGGKTEKFMTLNWASHEYEVYATYIRAGHSTPTDFFSLGSFRTL